ncbi:MAG: MFS transporter [Acidobacteria bacterium]|nr:MFS transporter [Acidobacteriota bacterium]
MRAAGCLDSLWAADQTEGSPAQSFRRVCDPRRREVVIDARHEQQALWLATASFALSFAAWGLISGLAPEFQALYGLNATETGLLVAVPVLLGSTARLPVGILADRVGGRVVFVVLLVVSAASAWLVSMTTSYHSLIAALFVLGLAGSTFSVGVVFVSRWTPPDRQGLALGLYGLGTAGQSMAVAFGPLAAARIGWAGTFRLTAAVLIVWAIAFAVLARNAPARPAPAPPPSLIALLRGAPSAWVLGGAYFLTFGGFVALALYLPTLLATLGVSAEDAGLRTAGFVALATAVRPLGGWLADRIGGAEVLSWALGGIAVFGLLLAWPSMVPLTVGALVCAAFMGLGNGAVFRLVPEHFPAATGVVTGLVGALGGLGGFFPPLLLGGFRDALGTYWPGFVLLSATALALRAATRRMFRPTDVIRHQALPIDLRQRVERVRAAAWGALLALALAAAVVIGSRNLQHFDAALVGYTFATLFATFGITYRYAMWLDRPPTRMYWRRGWEAFLGRRRGWPQAWKLAGRAVADVAGNRFIFRRGALRGAAHWLIMWGCVLAAAITFPLVWGWIHFETVPGDLERYRAFLFGVPVQEFPVESPIAFLLFHGLVWSSLLVIAGVVIAFRRRMIDHGAVATQQFGQDILPLLLLFAISVTGLMLTASYTWMRGYAYDFLAILHASTVILTLLWLPFGKLFHVFQRPAQLGVGVYKDAIANGEAARCRRCGAAYAAAPLVDDLTVVERELGFRYEMPDGSHYQQICPRCRRALFGLAQGALWAGIKD